MPEMAGTPGDSSRALRRCRLGQAAKSPLAMRLPRSGSRIAAPVGVTRARAAKSPLAMASSSKIRLVARNPSSAIAASLPAGAVCTGRQGNPIKAARGCTASKRTDSALRACRRFGHRVPLGGPISALRACRRFGHRTASEPQRRRLHHQRQGAHLGQHRPPAPARPARPGRSRRRPGSARPRWKVAMLMPALASVMPKRPMKPGLSWLVTYSMCGREIGLHLDALDLDQARPGPAEQRAGDASASAGRSPR